MIDRTAARDQLHARFHDETTGPPNGTEVAVRCTDHGRFIVWCTPPAPPCRVACPTECGAPRGVRSCPASRGVPVTPNGMQGSWTWPALTSPVRPAVLAALPEDGSPITRKELLAKVRALCPDRTVGTISVYIHDMGTSPASGVTRVGHGLYRRTTPRINAASGEHPT